MRTAKELLHDYQHIIGDLTLVMGSKGVFDVEVDGELLYSKYATGRLAHDGEVFDLVVEHYAKDVAPYER